MKILEIGSGEKKEYKNSICLDKEKTKITDVVWNLEKIPLPFKKNYFDLIYASHVLEHIKNFDELMIDLHRILKKSGKVRIKVPYGQSYLAKHPYHVRFFSLNSFSEGWNLEYQKLFKVKKRYFRMGVTKFTSFLNALNPIINISQPFQEFCEVFLFNFFIPPQEIEFELERK